MKNIECEARLVQRIRLVSSTIRSTNGPWSF